MHSFRFHSVHFTSIFMMAAMALLLLSMPGQAQFAPGEAKGYYLLDSYGGIHTAGNISGTLDFTDFPLAPDNYVGLATTPSGEGLWGLDRLGNVWTKGDATGASEAPMFGWDIARDIEAASDSAGYFVLDGFGGVHALGSGSPAPWAEDMGRPYFGWDIARDFEVLGDGYVLLDGYGGVHPVGNAGQQATDGLVSAYFGWDIARDIELVPAILGGTGFWQLDGFGGVHTRGGEAAFYPTFYFGWDIARDLELVFFPDVGFTYWQLDGYGAIHPSAERMDIPDLRRLVRFSSSHYLGFDAAVDFEVISEPGPALTATFTPTPSDTPSPTITFTPTQTETQFHTPTPTETQFQTKAGEFDTEKVLSLLGLNG